MRFRFYNFNLSINDLVAAEDRYHTSCLSRFENPITKYASRGRPPSSAKLTAFNFIRGKMEDHFKLYTVKEFHQAMEKIDDDFYSSKMTKIKLKPIFLVAHNYPLIFVNSNIYINLFMI